MPGLPADTDAWREEIAAAFAAARSGLADGDDARDEELWHHMEDRAVALARAARGLPELAGGQEDLDRIVDAITDLTERLRRFGGGDPDDHHVTEEQFFLLYYLAAQVHGQALSEAEAGSVVEACWDDDGNGDDEVEEPWEVQRPPPTTPAAWLDEASAAWREAGRPPPLHTSDGRPVAASGDDLRESGVILALHRRGCTPPAEAVYGLIGVISEMEADIATLGPELATLKRNPAMAFVLYYVWTHILIGHADEPMAMAVVRQAAAHLDGFGDGGPSPQRGSSRFRRNN